MNKRVRFSWSILSFFFVWLGAYIFRSIPNGLLNDRLCVFIDWRFGVSLTCFVVGLIIAEHIGRNTK